MVPGLVTLTASCGFVSISWASCYPWVLDLPWCEIWVFALSVSLGIVSCCVSGGLVLWYENSYEDLCPWSI